MNIKPCLTPRERGIFLTTDENQTVLRITLLQNQNDKALWPIGLVSIRLNKAETDFFSEGAVAWA